MWNMEQGGEEVGDSLSSYYINNYHRYLTDLHPSYFQQQFLGIGAIQGVQKTRLVSGVFASAKTQTWSRCGENAYHQTRWKGMERFWN